MNSYTERMVMAGPRHYREVLQEALTDISKKLNDFLEGSYEIDIPLYAAAFHITAQALCAQLDEQGLEAYNTVLRLTAAVITPTVEEDRP